MTQEPVPDWGTGVLPIFCQTHSDPLKVGKTNHNVGELACILGLNNSHNESPFFLPWVSKTQPISNPFNLMLFIPETDMLFPCWNSQSFHLHMGRILCFTTQAMNRFIPHVHRARPLNGFENSLTWAENRIKCVLLTTWDGNSIFFSEPGSARFAKVTVKWLYGMEFP